MAAFVFPSNPTQDQIVTGPAGQQFQWDGEKWVAIGGGGGGGGGGGAQIRLVADEATAQTASEADPANFYVWPGDGGGGGGDGIAGVSSFNGRIGAVTLTANDILTLVGTGNWLPLTGGSLTGALNLPQATVSQLTFGNPSSPQAMITSPTTSPAGQLSFGIGAQLVGGSWISTNATRSAFFGLDATSLAFVTGIAPVGTAFTGPMLGTLFELNYAGNMTLKGNLTLGGNAITALQAVPLQQVQALVAASSGGPAVSVGSTPPASPAVGALWFDPTNLQTYVWITNGSTQWVPIVNRGGAVSASVQIGFPFSGKPAAGVKVTIPMAQPISIPTNLVGSTLFAQTPPTGSVTFTLNKINAAGTVSLVGTLLVLAGQRTLAGGGGLGATLQVGEALQLVAPDPADGALADVGITILAQRV